MNSNDHKRWWRLPRNKRTVRPEATPHPDMPLWLRWMIKVGQPAVAFGVLALCAPGEHHLATLAGWDSRLAWVMAGVCAAYGGIASAIAANLPTGHPGKRVALGGATASLGLAMAVQPVSHLFVTGWLSADPRAPWELVVFVSCIPAPVLGHVLHVAAMHDGGQPAHQPATAPDQATVTPEPEPVTPVYQDETVPVAQDAPLPDMPVKLLTTAALGIRLGVSRGTIQRWKAEGKITPVEEHPTRGNLYHPDTQAAS